MHVARIEAKYIVGTNLTGCVAMKKLRDFLSDQSGATAIEYALIASAVFVAIVAVVNRVGAKLNTVFTTVSNGL